MDFDFSQMSDAELESRAAAIITESEAEGADLEALGAEARALASEREARAAEQQRVEQRQAIANGLGAVIRNFEEERNMPEQRTYNAESPEFRSAWLKNIAVCNGQRLFGDLTAEERAAFTTTTANTPQVVPTVIENRIIELVESMAPMYEDASRSGMEQGFAVPRHKGIKQGDAKGVAEGTANEDEQSEWDQISLDGVEIKKHVVISRKMKFKSIDAFEAWMVQHIAERIAVARERLILARLDGVAPEGGSAVLNVGIDAENILPSETYSDASMRKIMARIKGLGVRTIYANSQTIWSGLVGIEDSSGKKLFIESTMADPVIAGRIYGANVKLDENLPDNVAYFGIPKKLLANDYTGTEIFRSMDSKTAAEVILGYTLFDAALENPKSFVKVTFTGAAAAAAAASED